MSVKPLVVLSREQLPKEGLPLRTRGQFVTDFGGEFQQIVDDLIETFKSLPTAIGLAAPQIGLSLQLAVINLKRDKSEPTFIIVNPKVLSVSSETEIQSEGCMSIPGYSGDVPRSLSVDFRCQDRFGNAHAFRAEGFLARVVAHEIDHLEGVLYVDRMSDLTELKLLQPN